MLDRETNDELLLPPRTRLLHIGPMKTGTTSLQMAAHRRRDALLANGVRYPGSALNHRRALGAILGWSVNTWSREKPLRPDLLDTDTAGIPPRKEWDELKAEIDADPERRIFVTHEFVSQADDEGAQRIVDALGGSVHVCVTLRAPGQIVPSLWAQSIRDDAQTETFEEWIARFYGKTPDRPIPERIRRAYDQGELVERWARLVGPENVTVIIVDKSQPGLLAGTLEAMLGLPGGTLDWPRSNDSLTAVDAELFRHVNSILKEKGASWSTFHNLVWQGAIKLGPERRSVGPDEPRVVLPPWAAAIADEDAHRFIEHIERTPVRVIGNLDNLAIPSRSAAWPSIVDVPIAIAAQAVAGAILAGQEARGVLRKQLNARTAELTKIKKELAAAEAERRKLAAELDRLRRSPSGPNGTGRTAEQLAAGTRRVAAGVKRRVKRRIDQRIRGRRP